jgi:hypothetical protein
MKRAPTGGIFPSLRILGKKQLLLTSRAIFSEKSFFIFISVVLLVAWYSFQASHRGALIGEVAVHAYSAQHASFRMVTPTDDVDFVRPPLLTLVLWLLYKAGIFAPLGVKVVFVVGNTLTALFLYRLVSSACGKTAAGYTLLFWLTLPLLNYVILTSETHVLFLLFLVLMVSTAWKILLASKTGWGTAALFGVLGGVSYLARHEGLFYFSLFFLVVCIWKWREQERFPLAMGIALLCFGAFVFLYFLTLRLQAGRWSAGTVLIEALLYHPLRISSIITAVELLPPESIWGDHPPSFFSAFVYAPDLMIERIIVNFRNLLHLLGGIKGIPLFLWPFLGMGTLGPLLREDHDFRRGLFGAFLLVGCVPTLGHLFFHWEERYLSPTGMFLLMGVGSGMAMTREALAAKFRSFPRVFSVACLLVAASLAGVPLSVTLSNETLLLSQNKAVKGATDAALWIRDNSPPDAAILGSSDFSDEDVLGSSVWPCAYSMRPLLLVKGKTSLLDEETLLEYVRREPRARNRELYLILREEFISHSEKALAQNPPGRWQQVAVFENCGRRVFLLRHSPCFLADRVP